MRDIENILRFSTDVSPFLVHLTRKYKGSTSSKNLSSILQSMKLKYGRPISEARFGYPYQDLTSEIRLRYFSAVSFTETPLDQIYCLLEIEDRDVNLEPY